MLIYLLLAIFVAMLYISYIKFDKDIVAPAFVLVFGYTFSIVCATANIDAWGIDLHWQTLGVLIYGTSLFVIISYLVKCQLQKKYAKENGEKKVLEAIEYNKKYVRYFCFFQIAVILLYVVNIYYVTTQLGDFNSFFDRMVAFRNWSSFGTAWIGSISFTVVNQLEQISSVSVLIFIYILAYNHVVKCTSKEDALLFIPIILSIVLMLVTGRRMGVLQFIMCLCMIISLFYRKFKKIVFEINFKVILICALTIIVGSTLFYYAKALVGRGASDLSYAHIFSYITMYVGGPVQLLDMFLLHPIESSSIWGKETFYSIIIQLSRMGVIDVQPYVMHLEFRDAVTGAVLGNIYTAYRSYIYDFGYLGLTIFPIIFAYCVSYLYYKVLYDKNLYKYSFWILLYMLVFPVVFFDFVRCLFFANIVSLTTIKKMAFLVGLSWIIVKDFKLKDVFSE